MVKVPKNGYFELQHLTTENGSSSLAAGESARIKTDGAFIYQAPETIPALPLLNLVVRNYSNETVGVVVGAGSSNKFSVDANGFVQLTEVVYDDLVLSNGSANSISLNDIKIVCYNDFASIKNYVNLVEQGVIMPYVKRNEY